MAARSKPPVTGSSHTLPFAKLSPQDFERLCLWLVKREGYSRAEHLGEAGSEGGRDVVAWKDGRRVVFQCKRVQAFTTAHARKEIEKLRALPAGEQPQELVFVVSRTVSVDTRAAIRVAWGDEESCQLWCGNELDERVKRYPEILEEFFQLPSPERETPAIRRNLPFPSLGSLFQGRDEMLDLLEEKLTHAPAGRVTAIAGKAVHGLGGVGKTRLAVEYAWKHASEHTALLFVVAGSPADLRRNLAALCSREVLDLPEQEATEEEVREEAVVRWLGAQPGWLLILDNIDSEEAAEAVDRLLRRLHGGQVLLTGRLARWSAEVEPIELDVLTEQAAADFLLARTKNKRRATKEDTAQAAMLARELGFLPLALEQAGAYIVERRLTLAAYLEEWRSRHDQVLTWFDPRVSHYSASIAVTWETSFERLSFAARGLLERLAWLGPESIPEALLDVPVPDSEPAADLRDALVELATYSLVTQAAEAPTFTVHRLVQDVTRRSLSKSPGIERLAEALRWVDDAFVGDAQDVRTWPTLDPLAPHAHAVVTHADAAGLVDPTARLMNQLGELLYAKALHAEAEPLMRRALAIDEKSLGPEHPNVAIRLNDLAQLLQDTNRVAEAEPLMRRALAIDEKSFGAEHPNVAIRLNNLAALLWATNRLSEAEPLMRRALTIDEKSFGPEHPDIAIDLNNLARVLQSTNRLSEAESLMRRALVIGEKSLGQEHPNVAIRLNNLASLLWTTNRFAEAEPLMRRALAIDEKSFGPEHPDIAIDLNNLAKLLQSTNRLSEAKPLMRRALTIFLDFTRRTGHEHPHLQVSFRNYAGLLRAMGQSEDQIKATLDALAQASG